MLAVSSLVDLNGLTCLEAARWYFSQGLKPIPWETDPNRPTRKKAAISNFSYQQYVTAPDSQFENLFQSWQSGWQVGLALAEPTGLFAIDVDSYDELNDFEDEFGRLPDETWRHTTGRNDGGEHFLIRRSNLLDGWPKHGPFSARYPHLEVKSNGFIAVPPSVHPTGQRYEWLTSCPPEPAECGVTLAAWLNRRQLQKAWQGAINGNGASGSGSSTGLDLAALLASGVPAGQPQDPTLRDLTWLLVQRGHSDAEIKSMWDVVVSKTTLLNPREPWTSADFERHLKGAREKLGSGTGHAELAWAAGARAPSEPAAPALAERVLVGEPAQPPIPEETAEVAEQPEPLDNEGMGNALAVHLLKFRQNGNIDLPATHETLPRSDLTSADFLEQIYKGVFTFSTQSRVWRHWDGVTHVPAEDANVPGIIQGYAYGYKEALRRIQASVIADQLMTGQTPDEAEETYRNIWKKHRVYRDQVFNNGCQVRILHQLEVRCSVNEANFDADTNEAPCDNGVVLWTPSGVRLEPHDRKRLVTRRLGEGVKFDPNAKAPVFHKFLESSVPDPAQQRWLQVELGAALFGKPWKGFINFIGRSNSGKSTFMRLMQKVFGTYASPIGIDAFVEGSRGNNEFRIHELKGARLVLASEPAPGRKIDAESVKALTGGDPQKTRMPYGTYVTWEPYCTIIIGSNQPMRLETSDVAMLNRIGPIAFSSNHELNPRLEDELAAELPGVLNWLLEGANLMALTGHPELPNSMVFLREAMADHVDDCLRFISEALENKMLTEDKDASTAKCVTARDLYSRYQLWCVQEGIRVPAGKKQFSQRVGRRYRIGRSNGSRFEGLLPGDTWANTAWN